MVKKLSAISVALIIALIFSVSSFADSLNILIDDGASLFTEEEIEFINSEANEFANDNNLSVAVVTTDDTMGKTTEKFADDYFDDLRFEDGWSEDGMLFVIDMFNREIHVSALGICIDKYSNDDLDLILDKGFDCVINDEYAKCIIAMLDEAKYLASNEAYQDEYIETGDWSTDDGEYAGGYYDDGSDYVSADSFSSDIIGIDFSNLMTYLVIGIVIGLITVFVVKSKYKNTGKGDEFDANDIHLDLTASNDTVISKNVITTKIPRNNNNNRPGGSGGVSVHRSSGGVSHRSASRKF